jgi:hypothetical protein
MDTPLVITLNGTSQIRNLKEKGICTFFYKEGQIISQSNLNSKSKNFSMIYYLTEFINFMESSLKPTLAADRKITLYSRTGEGNVIASLILLLDTNTLRYCLQNGSIKEISFIDFLSHQVPLDESLADELSIEKEKLYTLIEKILLHKNLLDDLYDKYTDFIKKSPRMNDFYIPNFNNY